MRFVVVALPLDVIFIAFAFFIPQLLRLPPPLRILFIDSPLSAAGQRCWELEGEKEKGPVGREMFLPLHARFPFLTQLLQPPSLFLEAATIPPAP